MVIIMKWLLINQCFSDSLLSLQGFNNSMILGRLQSYNVDS